MGSTTPQETLHDQTRQTPVHHHYHHNPHQLDQENFDKLTVSELIQLLEQRDSEIRRLKLELERYKAALIHLKLDKASSEDERLLSAKGFLDDTIESLQGSSGLRTERTLSVASEPTKKFDTSLSTKDISSQVITQSPVVAPISLANSRSTKVIFKTSSDVKEGLSCEDATRKLVEAPDSEDRIRSVVDANDNSTRSEMQDIIQDVGEIDLNLELKKSRKRRRKNRKATHSGDQDFNECDKNDGKEEKHDKINIEEEFTDNNDHNVEDYEDEGDGDEDDEEEGDDDITDGLLTSLTDAAISNLSQLAALQERCESQSKALADEEFPAAAVVTAVSSKQKQHQDQNQSLSRLGVFARQSTSEGLSSTVVGTSGSSSSHLDRGHHQQILDDGFDIQDPFSASNLANQAALALSTGGSSFMARAIDGNSRSSSLSHGSTMKAPQDLSSNQSLASVVAAAAAAAAEAAVVNDQQRHPQSKQHHLQQFPPNQQHHHHHHQQQHLHSQRSRLVSSSIASPDYYQGLQHQQQSGLSHQITSPISSLHFSPSITSPSPISLIGGPLHQTRRSISNASSNILSPISSPNYSRRQFLADRGLPLMSPSPTTSLVTVGSSSGIGSAAGSAHMLQMAQQQHHHHHHHHQQQHPHSQQRSASALAGPISTASTSSAALSSGATPTAVSPLMTSKNSSQARLNNMQIRHKFGYLGSGRGQFNSPHGFCLGLNQEIVVADTNNHRVCIFDKDGTYLTQFGSPGKEEGQLWNPRKVAILHRPSSCGDSGSSSASVGGPSSLGAQRSSSCSVSTFSTNFTSGGGIQSTTGVSSGGHFASEPLYVVCDRGAERSRMQLFTKDGAFIKKIGIHYIDIVAGLAITQSGLIIVVDSVSPTVYIINAETGTLNGWFDCSGHMKEPSDIAVKSDIPNNEYFICDFKGHCVVVFSEQGDYLRKIGHDGLTSYPNGIDISDDGDILVGDSHGNRFHVVVFDRNGKYA